MNNYTVIYDWIYDLLCYIEVSAVGGGMEGCPPLIIGDIQVSLVVGQKFNHFKLAINACLEGKQWQE